MSPLLAILIAVAMHVTWNLFARHTRPDAEFLWWAVGGHLLLFAPWTLPAMAREATDTVTLVGCVTVSSVALFVYFAALRTAYRRAPVALVYPLARSAPLLIALVGVVFVGDRLSVLGWTGIIASTFAIVMLGASGRHGETRGALLPAALAACGTTVYSLADKVAVAQLPGYPAQLGYVSATYTGAWVLYTLWLRRARGQWWPDGHPGMVPLLIGALFIGTGYGLVIGAMRVIPAAYAVALSNLGIVVAALLSVLVFHEREHAAQRLTWATLLAASLLLIAVQV
ncbi:MAG TPA: EamA family transporter [Gammaproteobacteria bacterium]|nr:EamA family transporter [Gammaproteobacteria bacterium]